MALDTADIKKIAELLGEVLGPQLRESVQQQTALRVEAAMVGVRDEIANAVAMAVRSSCESLEQKFASLALAQEAAAQSLSETLNGFQLEVVDVQEKVAALGGEKDALVSTVAEVQQSIGGLASNESVGKATESLLAELGEVRREVQEIPEPPRPIALLTDAGEFSEPARAFIDVAVRTVFQQMVDAAMKAADDRIAEAREAVQAMVVAYGKDYDEALADVNLHAKQTNEDVQKVNEQLLSMSNDFHTRLMQMDSKAAEAVAVLQNDHASRLKLIDERIERFVEEVVGVDQCVLANVEAIKAVDERTGKLEALPADIDKQAAQITELLATTAKTTTLVSEGFISINEARELLGSLRVSHDAHVKLLEDTLTAQGRHDEQISKLNDETTSITSSYVELADEHTRAVNDHTQKLAAALAELYELKTNFATYKDTTEVNVRSLAEDQLAQITKLGLQLEEQTTLRAAATETMAGLKVEIDALLAATKSMENGLQDAAKLHDANNAAVQKQIQDVIESSVNQYLELKKALDDNLEFIGKQFVEYGAKHKAFDDAIAATAEQAKDMMSGLPTNEHVKAVQEEFTKLLGDLGVFVNTISEDHKVLETSIKEYKALVPGLLDAAIKDAVPVMESAALAAVDTAFSGLPEQARAAAVEAAVAAVPGAVAPLVAELAEPLVAQARAVATQVAAESRQEILLAATESAGVAAEQHLDTQTPGIMQAAVEAAVGAAKTTAEATAQGVGAAAGAAALKETLPVIITHLETTLTPVAKAAGAEGAEASISQATQAIEGQILDAAADAYGKLNLELREALNPEPLIKAGLDKAVASLPDTVRKEVVEALEPVQTRLSLHIEKRIQMEVDRIPPPRDGQNGVDGVNGKDGRDGKMKPMVPWEPGDYERGALVVHERGVWQAIHPTEEEPTPGCRYWECVVSGVKNFEAVPQADGRTIEFHMELSDGAFTKSVVRLDVPVNRGLWNVDTVFDKDDVVTYDGSSWIATKSGKLPRPGSTSESWRLMTKHGRDGKDQKQLPPPEPPKNLYVGEWAPETEYKQGQIVDHAGVRWMASRTTKERPPFTLLVSNDTWTKMGASQ